MALERVAESGPVLWQDLQQELREGKEELTQERAAAERLAAAQAELTAATAALQNDNAAATEQATQLRGLNAALTSQVRMPCEHRHSPFSLPAVCPLPP